jgi:predicted transglutaminase-like cysteine proteinase
LIGLYLLIAVLLGRRRQFLTGLLISGSLLLGTAKAAPYVPGVQRDEQAIQRLHDWQSLITHSLHLNDAAKLQAVNAFFNQHIRYGDDLEVWGQVDYWASPWETLEQGAGDCEDYAIAKYFSLRLLGISEQQLRLAYSTQVSTQQAHMVLGYWRDDGEFPLLLDNLNSQVLPSDKRPDLLIRFAFDSAHLYSFTQRSLIAVGDARLLPVWQDLKRKVRLQSHRYQSAIQLAAAGLLRDKQGT